MSTTLTLTGLDVAFGARTLVTRPRPGALRR